MAKLKPNYKTKDEIPEALAEYYVEKDGAFVLDVEGGMGKTDKDVATTMEALRKERAAHKTTKDTLATWTSLGDSVETVQESLDSIPELQAAAGTGGDPKEAQAKVQAAIEAGLNKERTKLQRQIDAEKKRADEAVAQVGVLSGEKKSRAIGDAVRDAATAAKVVPHALDDVLLYGDRLFDIDEAGKVVAKDGVPGVTPGVDVATWLGEQAEKKPHWWPQSQGGGAQGGSGVGGVALADNPWTAQNWNVTKQISIIREKGEAKAEAIAKAAGSSVNATRPPVKK